tara:strand:- start:27 stop:1103 length:1077 start_codon:yes stop_codon:yes gene_type:complete
MGKEPDTASEHDLKPAGKLLLRALSGETLTTPPVWLMRQAGRYLPEYRELRADAGSFLDLCYTPKLATEVTLQPIRRYGFDAAILFADILLIPDALGQDVRFVEGEGPVLEPVRSAADVAGLDLARLHDGLAPVYETVASLSRSLPEAVTLIGFAGAPWTVATYMVEGGTSRDHATVRRWALSDPEGFGRLIDLLVEATAEYLIAQVRAGAEVIQLFDTWAGALPETAFARWCVAPVRALVERFHEACPGIPIIGFPRGAGAGYARYVGDTGVDGVSLDPTVPLDWAAQVLQPVATVQGNLDPMLVVVGGEAMAAEVRRIRGALGGGPFIFNLGHGIVPQTPPEHVAELVRLVRAPAA